jgi:hypothetical protein
MLVKIAHEPTESAHGRAANEAAVDVVRWLVASQAQEFAGAKWALGLRMSGATGQRLSTGRSPAGP